MGNKLKKQNATILTENEINLLANSTNLSRDRVLAIHREFLVIVKIFFFGDK